MNLKNLEAYIDTVIVQRGQSYFASGMVEELEEYEPDSWQAWVEGTDDYEIEIRLSGDKVTYQTCTCPYDHGPICKHVTATLMAIREQKQQAAKQPKKSKAKHLSKAEQLDRVLAKLKREELEAAIRDLLRDRHTRDNFLLRFQHLTENAEPLSKRYRSLFDSIVRSHSDRHGFIDYGSTYNFTDEADELLSSLLQTGIPANDKVNCCLTIIDSLIQNVVNSIDDSNGSLGEINYQMRNVLEAAWPDLATEQQAACFKQTLQYHYGGLEEYGLEAFDELLAEWAEAKPDYQTLYLTELDRQINKTSHDFSREYKTRQKYQLLKRWGRTDDATALAKQHMEIAEFRQHFVEQAIEQENYAEARRLIQKGITIAEQQRYPGKVNNWRKILVDIAQRENDLPTIRTELFTLMENSRFELEMYKKYKATYPQQEWEEVRHGIYEQIQTKGARADTLAAILNEEDEVEALFKLIHTQKYGAISLFKRYIKRLAKAFPEETVATYARAIRVNMKQTGRGVYEEAARDMQALAALPGGKEPMQLLLAELCAQYKNRKAMLEVFKRVFG